MKESSLIVPDNTSGRPHPKLAGINLAFDRVSPKLTDRFSYYARELL
jgi:hypothetical protein